MLRLLFVCCTTLVLFAVSSAIGANEEGGQTKDPIAAQKLKSQVADAIAKSRKLEKTDPVGAKSDLSYWKGRVEESPHLAAHDRKQMLGQLKLRLNEVQNIIVQRRVDEELKAYGKKKSSSSGTGSSGSTSQLAKDTIAGTKGALDSSKDDTKKKQDNFLKTVSGNEKSSEYPDFDKPVVFAKNWKELSALRKKQAEQPLTAKEKKLLKALESTYKPDYDNSRFRDVIEHIQEKAGITLIIDDSSMREAMVEYSDPVTFKTNEPVTVRTILKKVLGDKGLTYIIKEGMVQVMTEKKASEMLVTRVYYVADLVVPIAADLRQPEYVYRKEKQVDLLTGIVTYRSIRERNPLHHRWQTLKKADELMELIKTTVAPGTWQPDGPNSISYNEQKMLIVVRAPAEMHYQLKPSR